MDYGKTALPRRPLMRGDMELCEASVSIVRGGDRHTISAPDVAPYALAQLLQQLDGTRDLDQVLERRSELSAENTVEFLAALDEAGLIDDAEPCQHMSGLDVLLMLEDLMDELSAETIFKNKFWKTCLDAEKPGDFPEKLAIGMVVENWHFLFRESYFDAPVLSYMSNTNVRLLVNQFFSEEYGHDEILLRALNAKGLTREDMRGSIPLPETLGLCNALAYWSHNDPLFFFVTLGILEGQGMKTDSFIEACERSGFPEEFVGPLRTHSNININSNHGSLSRSIFRNVPAIDHHTVDRLRRQTASFIELYDAFYTGVWRHYTSDEPLLRRVSEL